MAFALRAQLLGSLLLLGLVPTGTARAEAPSNEAAVETRRQRAKLEFRRGADLYSAGQYEKAVSAFMAADQLAPSGALSFNIALAYEHLGDTSGALRWYRDYLRRSPRAPNIAAVQARVRELSTMLSRGGLQQLSVVSTPSGAIVMVDGRALGVTPFTGDLALGSHRLQLDLAGYRDPGHAITLLPSAPQDLDVTLVTQPRLEHRDPIVGPSRDRDAGRRFGIAPWLIAGTGAAGLSGALGFELARRSDEEAARRATTQLEFKTQTDTMQRHQTTARVLGGIGGAAFVTGALMLLFNQHTSSAPRVGLGCTPRGCTASAQGSF